MILRFNSSRRSFLRESAVRRLEKKLLENGYKSLEEFSADRRHADKWLGQERIAELEQMRLVKEKERKEQPVQLSLFVIWKLNKTQEVLLGTAVIFYAGIFI